MNYLEKHVPKTNTTFICEETPQKLKKKGVKGKKKISIPNILYKIYKKFSTLTQGGWEPNC